MYLNAYYIHQYHYCLPPRHIEYDMKWMKANGFDAVSIVINEIDLKKTVYNIDQVFNIAKKEGLDVHLVPSRWGGLVAGTPGMKSNFSALHPEVCLVNEDGSLRASPLYGSIASVNNPATYEFFTIIIDKIYKRWPFDGLIWDEPKIFNKKDITQEALKIRPEGAGLEWDNHRAALFFDKVGEYLYQVKSDIRISMFLYAFTEDAIVEECAKIKNLDDLGLDGRPFRPDDSNKTLLGNALRFKDHAHKEGKTSFMLIENQDLTKANDQKMDQHFSEILDYNMEHVLAYYYPRNCEDPDGNMQVVMKHLKKYI